MPNAPPCLPDAPESRRRYALAALRHAADRVAIAAEGRRNDTLNRETFAMARFIAEGSLDPADIAAAMAYAGRQAGLGRHEIQATLTSALGVGVRR